MQRFRQMKSLQKFASIHVSLNNHFNQERKLVDRQNYKLPLSAARRAFRTRLTPPFKQRSVPIVLTASRVGTPPLLH